MLSGTCRKTRKEEVGRKNRKLSKGKEFEKGRQQMQGKVRKMKCGKEKNGVGKGRVGKRGTRKEDKEPKKD